MEALAEGSEGSDDEPEREIKKSRLLWLRSQKRVLMQVSCIE